MSSKTYLGHQILFRFNLKILLCLIFCIYSYRVCYSQSTTVKLNSFTVESSHPVTEGKWKSIKTEIGGALTFPDMKLDKYPVVLYLLSSGGFGSSDQEWIDLFLKNGYAVLWIDQYTSRNLSLKTGLTASQSGMTDMSFLHDTAAAVKFLKSQKNIDASRIASFGRSWGGGVQIYMTEQWYVSHAMDGEIPRIRIALYPACYLTPKKPTPTPGKTFLFLGEKDNWNEARPCIDYADRLREAGGTISVKVYPDAFHAFESHLPKREINVEVWGRCQNIWDTETLEIENTREGTRHSMRDGQWGPVWDKCVKKDWVSIQGTPHLKQVVQEDVLKVLASEL